MDKVRYNKKSPIFHYRYHPKYMDDPYCKYDRPQYKRWLRLLYILCMEGRISK